jgi:hypothetical protein
VKSPETLVAEATTQLVEDLLALGVSAQVAQGGPALERVSSRLSGQEAYGYIHVHQRPITWINIACWVNSAIPLLRMYARYGIPDRNIPPRLQHLQLTLTRSGSFLLLGTLGRVTDLWWRGKDAGSHLLQRLNDDQHTRAALTSNLGTSARIPQADNPAWISAHPEQGFWLLSTPYPSEDMYPLSADSWHAYEAIAATLLNTPRAN